MFAYSLSNLIWFGVEKYMIEPISETDPMRYPSLSGYRNFETMASENPMKESERIASRHLFGFQSKVTPQKVVKKKAPKSRLNLKLIGVFEYGGRGKAIIEHQGKQNAYGIGETIDPIDAVVKEIYASYVVIERSGRDERIELVKDKLEANFSPLTNESNLKSPDIADHFVKFRALAMDDPATAFKKVRFIPEKGSSGLQGYRIVSGGKDRLFVTKFGLRNGDLITTVNGIDLITPGRAMEAMNELQNADLITVDFLRAGRKESLEVLLQE